MKNAIIIHGKPSRENYYDPERTSSSNFAWIPWVQKQLIINDIKTDTPEMPHSYSPVYHVWKTEFERFDITPETTLVGHSCGGGFLIRWLSENKDRKVGKVILVAPSIDPHRKIKTDWSDYEIDSELAKRAREVVIFASDNDSEASGISVQTLKDSIEGIRMVEFPGYGHFIPEHMGQDTFPELVKEILK